MLRPLIRILIELAARVIAHLFDDWMPPWF